MARRSELFGDVESTLGRPRTAPLQRDSFFQPPVFQPPPPATDHLSNIDGNEQATAQSGTGSAPATTAAAAGAGAPTNTKPGWWAQNGKWVIVSVIVAIIVALLIWFLTAYSSGGGDGTANALKIAKKSHQDEDTKDVKDTSAKDKKADKSDKKDKSDPLGPEPENKSFIPTAAEKKHQSMSLDPTTTDDLAEQLKAATGKIAEVEKEHQQDKERVKVLLAKLRGEMEFLRNERAQKVQENQQLAEKVAALTARLAQAEQVGAEVAPKPAFSFDDTASVLALETSAIARAEATAAAAAAERGMNGSVEMP